MKRFSVVFALLLAVPGARAEGPDDEYVRIYNLIQEADKRDRGGQLSEALPKYLEAQAALQQFRKGQPDWNPKVVGFRLNYMADKIAALSPRVPAPVALAAKPAATPSAGPAQPAPPVSARDWENELKALQDRVNQLQADKVVLEAKVKEGLTAQPAAARPRELAQAEAKILDLLKENDLLKVALEQEKARPAPVRETKALDEARQALAEADRKLAERATTATELARTKAESLDLLKANALLEVVLDQEKARPALVPDTKALDEARQALAEANRKLAEQANLAAGLAKAEARIQDLLDANDLLKLSLDQEKTKPAPAPDTKALDEARQALAEANRKLAEQIKVANELAVDNITLQNKLKSLTSNLANAAGPAAGTNLIGPGNRLAVSGVRMGPRGFSIVFPTVTGKVYAVEYSETLTKWSVLVSGLAGTNEMMEVTDPGAFGNARRFYRVRVSQ